MLDLAFSAAGWEDYLYWQSHDKKTLKRINELIKVSIRTPESGIGKPEALRGNLSGWYSRRITETDRMVYCVRGTVLLIAQLRYHY